nr:MAG TPA: hypothetical protein [Caudoviricetes sp.]
MFFNHSNREPYTKTTYPLYRCICIHTKQLKYVLDKKRTQLQ